MQELQSKASTSLSEAMGDLSDVSPNVEERCLASAVLRGCRRIVSCPNLAPLLDISDELDEGSGSERDSGKFTCPKKIEGGANSSDAKGVSSERRNNSFSESSSSLYRVVPASSKD
eukprot:1188201-Prorocentrum_minimum.AAC.3